MSDINGKYKQIMENIEKNIKDPELLSFVKDEFSELSMLFIDMLDRVTRLTDNKLQELEVKQQEILSKINSVQSIVDGIESDIYEEDDNYEFEIVCPYCNYEFTADIEDESKEEVHCPECHNTIELDWNLEEESSGCSGSCSHCDVGCVAEDGEDYDLTSKSNQNKNEKYNNEKANREEDEDDKEDM